MLTGLKQNGESVKHIKPTTLFICCCDNRIMPYKITGKKPGELFILRNIGNLIPPYDKKEENSVGAAIEYAVEQLEITEIIVCGHSDCGAMKAVLKNTKENSSLHNWLKYAVKPDKHTSPDELSQANVLFQIKNLKTYPVVKIQGLWVDLDTNTVKNIF